MDSLHKSLDTLKILRCNMTSFFQQLGTGFRIEGSEGDTLEEREKATKNILITETQKLKDNYT